MHLNTRSWSRGRLKEDHHYVLRARPRPMRRFDSVQVLTRLRELNLTFKRLYTTSCSTVQSFPTYPAPVNAQFGTLPTASAIACSPRTRTRSLRSQTQPRNRERRLLLDEVLVAKGILSGVCDVQEAVETSVPKRPNQDDSGFS